MFRPKLACSFCRRSEAEVSKLVAGPHVYICDRCAAEVIRIMNDSDRTEAAHASRSASSNALRRLRHWWRHSSGSNERQSVTNPLTSAV